MTLTENLIIFGVAAIVDSLIALSIYLYLHK